MIKIISIDAATKSLAIACLEFNNIYQQIEEIIKLIKTNFNESTLEKCNEILNPINIKSLDVIDLIPNQKVSKCNIIEISYELMKYIHNFTKNLQECKWFDNSVHIVIEYQMGPNRKSGDIQTQLIYHFLQFLPIKNIHIIRPSLKNKLYFPKDINSQHNSHIERYKKKYTGNKSHTKYIFIQWLTAYNKLNYIKNINKKNYADIADAFCQANAWYLENINPTK
jgi:hypothetical protein